MLYHVRLKEEAQGQWFQLVEAFHRVQGKVAVAVFEIHALQKAQKAAILTSLDEDDKRWLEPEAAEAWIRSSAKLVTLRPVVERVDYYREVLDEMVESGTTQVGAPTLASAS